MASWLRHITRVPLKLLLPLTPKEQLIKWRIHRQVWAQMRSGFYIFCKTFGALSILCHNWRRDVLHLWCEVVSQLCPGQHQEMQKGLVYTAYPCVSRKDEGVTRRPWLFMKNLKVRSKQICIKYKISDTVKLSVLSSRSASDPLLPLSNVNTGIEESRLSRHTYVLSAQIAQEISIQTFIALL